MADQGAGGVGEHWWNLPLKRNIIICIGAALALTWPIVNRFSSLGSSAGFTSFDVGVLFVLASAWIVSVIVTTHKQNVSLVESFVDSLGLPGTIVSLTGFLQAID